VQARTMLFVVPLALLFLAAAPAVRAAEISVVSPTNEETIHSNQGDLTVQVAHAGGTPESGVRLVLDGTPLPHIYRGNVIELRGIDRGTHTLHAVLLDARGQPAATSAPVTFYMWQASRLFPNRK